MDTGRIRLSGEAPSDVSLSDDARSLYLSFADLSRKTSYHLVVSAGAIASRSGVANREAITPSFSTAAAEPAAPVRVSVGFAAGSIVKGAYAFVLDRGGSALVVFDLSDPAHPVERAPFILGWMPHAMALAGDQPTVRPAGGKRNPPCDPRHERSWQGDSGLAACVGEQRDLLLVAGHTADRKGQHLRVLDVSAPQTSAR